MTFWHLTSYSDFPTDQTFHQFDDFDTFTELRVVSMEDFPNMPCLFSTFHLEDLGAFSICLIFNSELKA